MKKGTYKFNNYKILEDKKSVQIEINSKKHGINYAYCDLEDWEKLKGYCWSILLTQGIFYLMSHVRSREKQISFHMHKIIMNPPKGMVVNHIDHNGLNNRKSNLEICTQKQNARYSNKPKTNTSGYKGVHWDKNSNGWMATIRTDMGKTYLGIFKNIHDAAKAYNEAALKYHGKFAVINKIKEVR